MVLHSKLSFLILFAENLLSISKVATALYDWPHWRWQCRLD